MLQQNKSVVSIAPDSIHGVTPYGNFTYNYRWRSITPLAITWRGTGLQVYIGYDLAVDIGRYHEVQTIEIECQDDCMKNIELISGRGNASLPTSGYMWIPKRPGDDGIAFDVTQPANIVVTIVSSQISNNWPTDMNESRLLPGHSGHRDVCKDGRVIQSE